MQVEPQHQQADAPTMRVPLISWVALIAVVVIVGGVGYMMWDRVFGGMRDTRGLVEVVSGGRAFAGVAVRPDGVRQRNPDRFEIRAGKAVVNVTRRRDQWIVELTYDDPSLLSAEDRAALTARWRLTRDRAFARALGVTPDQIKQLAQIPGGEVTLISDEETKRVEKLFQAYLKAEPPRTSQSAALVSAAREIGRENHARAREELRQRINQIRSILTAEQIVQFRPG